MTLAEGKGFAWVPAAGEDREEGDHSIEVRLEEEEGEEGRNWSSSRDLAFD
jgi:hypothetical protein